MASPVSDAKAFEAWAASALRRPTADGAGKRAAGIKQVPWQDEPEGVHILAAERHIARYWAGQSYDHDSGAHTLVHAAWRLLAVAYQEEHGYG